MVAGPGPAGYSGTPLVQKLGIKAGMTVALLGAPDGFEDLLAGMPDDVTLRRRSQGHVDLAITFQTERAVLEQRLPAILRALDRAGSLWVAWPKKASKVATDISEDTVRDVVLPIGLVDVKVCAIDQTWSGLKIMWRRENR
ncbi:MAG: DUF3052 domain-containing protein [Acidimicrobiales bacterium]